MGVVLTKPAAPNKDFGQIGELFYFFMGGSPGSILFGRSVNSLKNVLFNRVDVSKPVCRDTFLCHRISPYVSDEIKNKLSIINTYQPNHNENCKFFDWVGNPFNSSLESTILLRIMGKEIAE
ncbi:Hypothetical protein CINCED_3A014513 [Cinara cedri]|uniref:Uncharacterized protein n=1 Tax=Cinara cedri TaxID=506608 RepID=A0A5E4LYJ2_9HEMI|nr:Hypothetical protein CINCED_3A014513 [Cinara cedri]